MVLHHLCHHQVSQHLNLHGWNHGMTELWDHRTVWVSRDLKNHPVPPPPRAGGCEGTWSPPSSSFPLRAARGRAQLRLRGRAAAGSGGKQRAGAEGQRRRGAAFPAAPALIGWLAASGGGRRVGAGGCALMAAAGGWAVQGEVSPPPPRFPSARRAPAALAPAPKGWRGSQADLRREGGGLKVSWSPWRRCRETWLVLIAGCALGALCGRWAQPVKEGPAHGRGWTR